MNEEIPEAESGSRQADGLELMCAGILRDQFGQRKSRALAKAMIRLEAEHNARRESESASSWRERIQAWLNTSRPRFRYALAVGLLLVIGLSARFLWSEGLLLPKRNST